MKKLILVVLIAILSASYAFADDSEKMTFENVTLGKEYKINGYAAVTLLSFEFVDAFQQWKEGVHETKSLDWNKGHPITPQISGNEADFAWLKADIRNLGKTDTKFRADISVKVIYDDEYEYKGWVRQFNYDYSTAILRFDGIGIVGGPTVLNPSDEETIIGPLYVGHYVFGCTLPMSIIEDKNAPLRMVITMRDNELIYNIR